MAHPSRPADLRREPALKRPGPSQDTARPQDDRSSVGISNPPAFERRHLTFPSIATAGRSFPLSFLPCAACVRVSEILVTGLFGHLWCYPLPLVCALQSIKEQASAPQHGIQPFFPTASFFIASFSASFLLLPQARLPCLFRLCLPPIHKSWLRILFLVFSFPFFFRIPPPSSYTPYLKRTHPPPTSLLLDVPSIP
ncbi:hypothetical protein GGI35DRAFT_340063 [Trichoderma velutinum]